MHIERAGSSLICYSLLHAVIFDMLFHKYAVLGITSQPPNAAPMFGWWDCNGAPSSFSHPIGPLLIFENHPSNAWGLLVLDSCSTQGRDAMIGNLLPMHDTSH